MCTLSFKQVKSQVQRCVAGISSALVAPRMLPKTLQLRWLQSFDAAMAAGQSHSGSGRAPAKSEEIEEDWF